MAEEDAFLDMAEEATPSVPPTGLGLDGNARVPTMEEILQMIESAAGLSDEEKASIKEDVIKFNTEQESILQGSIPTAAATAGGLFAPSTILFIVFVSIVVLIIGFFAYKLIKAEQDKQKSKELKRLAREQRRNKRKNA